MINGLSRRSLLSAAVTGVSPYFTGCLGIFNPENTSDENSDRNPRGEENFERMRNENGLEYHKSEIMEAQEGIFKSDFYFVELGPGEWADLSIETPDNPDMAVFLEAWEGSCTAAFITGESFEQDYPKDSLKGRVLSHDSDTDSPAYTVGKTTESDEWVAVVDNTGSIGPFDGKEPVDGFFAIGKRIG